jgi:hypothetical protein
MKRTPGIHLLLLAVVLVAFCRIAGHEFINWDDPYTIASNPLVTQPTWQSITHYWQHGAAGLWIPLTYTIWIGLSWISSVGGANAGPNSWIFHAVSVALHAINTLLVYRIVRRVSPGHAAWPAALGALIFAAHPLQVEAVAWASGMKDVLSATLALFAIDRHLATIDQPRLDLLALLAFTLSMLAKPSGVVAIPIVVILDRMMLQRDWRQIAVSLAPWCAVALPIAIVARVVQSTIGVPPIPIALRPLIALDALAFYLWKLIWPVNLVPDYGRLVSVIIERRWFLWSWIIPTLLAAIFGMTRKRAKPAAAGALIFVTALLPVLSFTPFLFQFYSTVADHYVYLSMLGVAIIASYFLERFQHRAIMIASVIVIGLLTARTISQASYWHDNERLFRHTLKVNSRSVASENNLGAALAEQGKYPEAIEHYNLALAINPDYRMAHTNLAQLYALINQPERGIEHMERALELWDQTPAGLAPRDSTKEHLLLAALLQQRGRYDDARRHLLKVLEAQPQNAEAKALLEKTRQPTTR